MLTREHVLTSTGRASATRLAVGSLVLLAAALVALWLLNRTPATAPASAPLVVYCAAGIKPPVEAIAAAYQKTYGVPIHLQYGGSQTLLAAIEVAKRGDLYLPADESYLVAAREKGLVAEVLPVAQMTVVLAVRKGNPKQVRSLDDLLRDNVVVGQAAPEAAAVGKLARAALERTGHWERLKAKTRVFKPTVNDVANDLKLGTVDAGFLWDAMLTEYPELEAVPVSALTNAASQLAIGVLKNCAQPTAALRFARYLAARDQGQPVFRQHGFRATDGDPWALNPELVLYAGAMLRPAIEDTIAQFERREGVEVTRVYNGCGILVAQMRGGQRPDAYFACDKSFMAQVSDLFYRPEDISGNPMIILTQKGNPRGIKDIKDLGAPGLRLGLAHEQQSALGALTKRMLQAHGLYEPIRANLKVESATGDFLVNQLRSGSLDAVIVYVSNGAMVKAETETIPIQLPEAFAVQPIAVGKEARYPQLAGRLHELIRTAESRERFVKLGFGWKLGEDQAGKGR